MRRLVLGCGTVGSDIIEALTGRTGDLHVITDDSGRVSALRDEHVAALEADPRDPDNYPDHANLVVVAGASATANLTVADRARERFPDAALVAYAGDDATEADLRALRELADRVIDPIGVVADRVLDVATGATAERLRGLVRTLRSVEGTLAVVAHDNPDPDAIASAIALVRIARFAGTDAEACYYGDISHQENRALVNLLDIEMRQLDPDTDPREEFAGFALVDHSRPGVNDSLPEEIDPLVVIDHHPPREPIDAEFLDLRDDVGATSTLLVEYLDRLGVTPDTQVATALLYGIRIDTKDFTREVSEADFDAAASLLSHADASVLDRVESPSFDPAVLNVLARAIGAREQRGSVVASCVGEIADRDALAQAAERLLDMEGVNTTLVYGYRDGVVYASGRTRGTDLDLGETLRDALDQIGSAGGHADMAGAQISLGILGDVGEDSKESLTEIVRDIVAGRFFETLEDAPATPTRSADRAVSFPDEG
ncbi:DHH family phosphoesterase [Halobaculum gomorrense]|uniref:NanoRNase/pAp phosphatase, hydrolyzes c-di-AMP and oligoRNAs n=1 Tax=Halobaculum gomorrense TaxID=43928 RepID=A0A1M5MZ29_9EURY|nr:DHH family phosphoesterase [Halobaculum gomorrense]SHG82475.1 nanoRNase/pAp phosphatase, hydrolyzes c-di-AMP and oligoRNAs [Halobaculum gomorrense]